MPISKLAAILLCLSLSACAASSEKVTFIPGPRQQLVPVEGNEFLASRQKITRVGLAHPPGLARIGRWVPFLVEMRNHGKTPIEFRMQDAMVAMTRADGEAVLPAKTLEEILEAEQRRPAMAEFIIGSLAHANVSLAYQAKSGIRQARRERREVMEALEQENLRNLDVARQYALKDHTLVPGTPYQALLFVEVPEALGGERNYTLRIKLGDELHELKVIQTLPKP